MDFSEYRNRVKRKLAKRKLRVEQQQLFKNLLQFREEHEGNLPDSNHKIWAEFCDLHVRSVREHWLRKSRTVNLFKPVTLAEKIEWLKLNDHREIFINFSDKLLVRDYVVRKTGEPKLINELYGVYDSADEIKTNLLPRQFVVKPNNGCSDLVIVSVPSQWNEESKKYLNKRLCRIHGLENWQWPYWHIRPKLLVEEYLEDQFDQLIDYKIHCFNGRPRFVKVCVDRGPKLKKLYFDMDWNRLPFVDRLYPKGSFPPPLENAFPCPKSFNEMVRFAEILSQDATFVRVDFYDVFGECRFGELTLYPGSGAGDSLQYYPDDWNYKLGSWLKLNPTNTNPKMAYATGIEALLLEKIKLRN